MAIDEQEHLGLARRAKNDPALERPGFPILKDDGPRTREFIEEIHEYIATVGGHYELWRDKVPGWQRQLRALRYEGRPRA